MNTEWENFLKENGALIENGQVSHFGDAENEIAVALNDDVLCDLSQFGIIRISGGDAQSFLQGQFSNDVTLVTPEQSQLNSYNSPKGRMYASFRLYQLGDAYLMQLPRENIDLTMKRLQMFVLRSNVKLEDISDEMLALGVSGPGAAALLGKQFNAVPTEVNQVAAWDKGLITKVPGPQARFIVLCAASDARAYWQILSSHAKPCGVATWKLLDIYAGIPNIYLATREEFVAQMVNFHSISGVSFTKGCYPGQEIVARMHYLGNLKKRMYRVHTSAAEQPAINSSVFVAGKEGGQSVGQIVDSCLSPKGGFDALAVLQIKSADEESLCIGSPDGHELTIEDLPYEVTNEA